MVIYNLEYSTLDKLGRAKNSRHVGLFRTVEEVEAAKVKTEASITNHKISFQVYVIDDLFLKGH
jgi:hypothetical protein